MVIPKNQFAEDRTIDPLNLQEEFLKQPGLFYYYAKQVEDAEDILRKAKLELEVWIADKKKRLIERAKDLGERPTAGIIEIEMKTHAKWRRLKTKVMKAQRELGLLKTAKDTMSEKRSSLMMLGAMYRENPEIFTSEKSARKKGNRKNKRGK